MDDYWAASANPHWAAVAELERAVAAQPGDAEARRRLGHALYAVAVASLSVTRDQTLEITSAQQLALAERVGRRILDLGVDDDKLRRDASALLDRVGNGRRWTWESRSAAIAGVVLAVVAGLAAAVLGGLTGNLVVIIGGATLSSLLVAGIVLRGRRQNWRIHAERVAPLIWRPGI
jgi:hypothetical protein